MQRALSGLKGVTKATVDLDRGRATVETAGAVPQEAMERAVHGQVILSWARSLLARLPLLGRRAL